MNLGSIYARILDKPCVVYKYSFRKCGRRNLGDCAPKTTKALFKKILIANRGEIACRIIKTANKMGIKTVAVYSEADVLSLHVKLADEAVCIGPPPARKSYLNMDVILDAMVKTNSEAVHPGYGFLSENYKFAKMVEDQNLTFIGPSAGVIQLMGDKLQSKRIAKEASVNTIPGFDGIVGEAEDCVEIARSIGYPVMIKASAGGGGKGMRIAWNDDEVLEGFKLSAQEAASSFGDNRLIIEKYITSPRHIEIQVLGDKHGNVIHLNERECSIQRRHQKVIEEAPSTFLDEETRRAMGAQAVNLCRKIGYSSAGTVEFLVDEKRHFYFLEMNTRLQVEHPITECITGVDLVEEMIKVAKGHPLGIKQEDVGIRGWAIESRVYAEDPYKNFGLPSTGRLYKYKEPCFGKEPSSSKEPSFNKGPSFNEEPASNKEPSVNNFSTEKSKELPLNVGIPTDLTKSNEVKEKGIRCDSGIEEGSEITIYYDPLICKLVGFGPTRPQAIEASKTALSSYVIRGVTHNIPLLMDILSSERFLAGQITTDFLKEEYPEGFTGCKVTLQEKDKLIAVAAALHVTNELRSREFLNGQKFSIHSKESWDLVVDSQSLTGKTDVHVRKTKDNLVVDLCGRSYEMGKRINLAGAFLRVDLGCIGVDFGDIGVDLIGVDPIGEKPLRARELFEVQLLSKNSRGEYLLGYQGSNFYFRVLSKVADDLLKFTLKPKKVDEAKFVISPMPGLVRSVGCKVGDFVEEGQQLLVIEAMKMQNSMTASTSGKVKGIYVGEGDKVAEDDVLVELE